MRLLPILAVLLTSLLAITPIAAQESDWQVIAIQDVDDTRELLTLTADGITGRITLPAEFPAHYEQLALSPAGDTLATLPAGWNRVVLAGVGDEGCCTEWAFTSEAVVISTLAGFSPDGQQIALSYVVENPMRSYMLLMDVTTGNIDVLIDMTTGSDSDPRFVTYPVLTGWDAEGIRFATSCVNCVDAALNNQMSLWEPVSGEVNRINQRYDHRNDRLEISGSTLEAVFALDYPTVADTDAIFWGVQEFGLRNAVVLTGPGAENGEAIVYATAEYTSPISRWVADGNAFIVFFTNDAVGNGDLVLASGETQPTDFAFGHFVTGTPDGWLTRQNGQLIHHQLAENAVTETTLGEIGSNFYVVKRTPLGETAASFPTAAPPEPVTCSGFATSRLLVGHLGRVTPGPANNMRSEPSTTSPIIAKIAGAEAFAILEGPVCAQGLAWWRVAFNNQEGWTAEGSGNAYWLELAPANGYRAPSP